MMFTRRTKALRRSAGFTLLELVVVIAILAILATIAVRSLSALEDQARFNATQHTLADVQASIDGDKSIRQPDGTMIPNGFVNDMGRLPNSVGTAEAPIPLQELWIQPTGVPSYSLKSPPVESDTVDIDIRIGTGWHGPYLQLPFGATTLTDGWGNPFTFSSNTATNLFAIQSYGSDATQGTTTSDPYSADVPATPIQFLVTDYSTTVVCMVTGSSAYGSAQSAKLFEPDPATPGTVTFVEGVQTGSNGNLIFTFNNANGGLAVTPGTRAIRLYADTAWTTPLATQYITVPKGGLTTVINLSATTSTTTQPTAPTSN